jgi:hypothetical protein
VNGIRLRYQERGVGRYIVYATVRILDQDQQQVPGAEVSVQWAYPDGAIEDQAAVSNLRSLARFRLRSTQTGLHEVCVMDIAKQGWLYDPEQNVVTCASLEIPE